MCPAPLPSTVAIRTHGRAQTFIWELACRKEASRKPAVSAGLSRPLWEQWLRKLWPMGGPCSHRGNGARRALRSSQPARARTRTAGHPEAPSPPPAPSADLGRFWKCLGEESLTGLLGIRLSLVDMPWLGPGGQHPRPPFHGLGPFQVCS